MPLWTPSRRGHLHDGTIKPKPSFKVVAAPMIQTLPDYTSAEGMWAVHVKENVHNILDKFRGH